MRQANAVLDYWFEAVDDQSPIGTDSPMVRRWFGKDETTDREIRERFEPDYLRAVRGDCADWTASARGCLALVVLLDQFPRNIYRDTRRAFASDSQALETALRAIEEGSDRELGLLQRMFLYMPLMHAESTQVQAKSLQLFGGLVQEARERGSPTVNFLAFSHDYAVKHAVIIERFGRYPHRNRVLGRESTPEELEFLKGPDSSF